MALRHNLPHSKLVSFKLCRFKISKKVAVLMRHIGSIHSNVGRAIFLVYNPNKNPIVKAIFKENNFSEGKFFDATKGKSGKRVATCQTDHSAIFDESTIWFVNLKEMNGDRVRNDFNDMLNHKFEGKNITTIRFIFG
jgi:hypothetical protein